MTWRRRDLLAIAGGALSAAACRTRPSSARTTPTTRDGPDVDRGHLLRSGALRQRPIDATENLDVIVVGGGVAGLCAALELERLGRTPTIVELEAQTGGTARGGELDGHAHPLGAHYLPEPHPRNRELIDLLDRLGLVQGRDRSGNAEFYPSHICAGPVERHFVRKKKSGEWFPGLYPFVGQSQAEADEWERFIDHLRAHDRHGSDGRPLFTLPLAEGSTELRHLDALSFGDYLEHHGFTGPRLRWVCDYACRDDYGATLSETSAYAGLHHFLCRGLEDDHDRGLIVFEGGNAELVRRLAKATKAAPRHEHLVYAVDADGPSVDVWDAKADRCLRLRGSAILWAAPTFVLDAILGREPGARSYSAWLVASLLLSEAPGGLGADLAWDNVPYQRPDLGYVYNAHQRPRDRIDRRVSISFYEALVDVPPAQARARLLKQNPAELGAWALERLSYMHPSLPESVLAMTVTPWGHAMVRPTVGSIFAPQRPLSTPRLATCSTDGAGIALFEEAFYAATRAAQAVAQLPA